MMKSFKNFGELIAHLSTIAAVEVVELKSGLKACAEAIERTAKSEIGEYQPAVGSFSEWPELADSTKVDRVSQGYTENDPLLRSGELRDSISHRVDGLDAVIGSTSDIMVWQENGTDRIPPRPVMGPAGARNARMVEKTIGHAAAKGMLYGSGVSIARLGNYEAD